MSRSDAAPLRADAFGEVDEDYSEDDEVVLGESDSSEEESEEEESEDAESEQEEHPDVGKGDKDLASRSKSSKHNVKVITALSKTKERLILEGDENVRAEGDASSDEEHERNTIGNVPLHWYDEFDHIGYDKSGKKLLRKEGGDVIDQYLASKDDPFYRRTVYDARNDQSTILTDRELVMVKRMLESKFPEAGMEAEPDYNDYFSSIKMITPLSSAPEPKRRFIPSKWERMKVLKLVRGIKEGRLKLGTKAPPKKKPDFYLMWGEDDTSIEEVAKRRKAPKHIPAPKVELPDHRESYHPPVEYLPSEEEAKEWLEAHPDDRKLNYLPSDFEQLRKVPAYQNYIRERFERCMDLYMCPRINTTKLNIDPQSLVPKLPSAKELRPYPTTVAVTYFGHNGRVRAIAVDPTGELLASGGDDQIVRIWEVDTGRCLATYNVSDKKDKTLARDAQPREGGDGEDGDDDNDDKQALTEEQDKSGKLPIVSLAWNPQSKYRVLAVGIGARVVLLHGGVGSCCSSDQAEQTHKMLSGGLQAENDSDMEEEEEDEEENDRQGEDEVGEDGEPTEEAKRKRALRLSKGIAAWAETGDNSPAALADGEACRTSIYFKAGKGGANAGLLTDLAWHAKGEYLVTVCNTARASAQVTVHHLSKRLSQQPIEFKRDQRVQKVLFHPTKPVLFVATKRYVNVYHLIKQVKMRQLKSGARWISSMALHPKGDNIVLGTYDRRVAWIDLDMSDRPWKTFKYHHRAVRSVAFHPRYPLMATAADDGLVHVFHARVFDDFAKDPFLVPVKVLKGHTPTLEGLGVFDCVFHPTQPWAFSAGADGRIQLFQNLN